jgi:hypothetical protein
MKIYINRKETTPFFFVVQRYTVCLKNKSKKYILTQHLQKNHDFTENFSTYNKIFPIYSVPLNACSLSIDSKRALKLPAPKPFAPILCIISKKSVGLS